jgi:hypothetical protein
VTCGVISADGITATGSYSIGTGGSVDAMSAAVAFFLFDRGVVGFFFSPPVLLLFRDLAGRVSGTIIDDDDLSSVVDVLKAENNV